MRKHVFTILTVFRFPASAASEELSSEPSIGPISLEALRLFSAAPPVASIRTVQDADREPEITEAYLHFVITFLRSSRRVRCKAHQVSSTLGGFALG